MMQVKFWGVRGSLPQSNGTLEWLDHFKRLMSQFFSEGYTKAAEVEQFISSKSAPEIGGYGSDTTCVEVSSGGIGHTRSLIIDGGSGLKKYNDLLALNNFSQTEHHILLTHFHFDHTIGIPYFMPHFLKGHKIHYYSPDAHCEQYIKALFQKPTFPVPYAQLSAEIIFHQIKSYEKYQIQNFTVQAYCTDHSDACYGYKIRSASGKTYSHAVDNEIIRQHAGELQQDAGLYQDTNLLYIDAQYSEEDMKEKSGWGHGTFNRAFEICRHFNVEQVLLGHHDPSHNLEDIKTLTYQAVKYFEENPLPQEVRLKWMFAFDGQVVEL
jgi:phosphoribosyl 1,2-cyclic phosphodiesterase